MFDLTGKNAFVTGGAKGIGKGIATALLECHASVMIADVDEAACQKTCDELSSKGRIMWTKLDITRRGQVDASINECIQKLGSIDVLVNNAGIYPFKPFLELSEEDWRRVLEVNLEGAFNCTQAAAKKMVDAGKGGRIINIASTAAVIGYAGLTHYCTTKAGLAGFTRALAIEMAPYKITVNSIGPGGVITPGTEAFMSDPKMLEANLAGVPAKRMGVPADIGAAAAFLASDESSYITGQLIVVDGGVSII